MIAVFDCSSLLSLSRYYLPNDKKNILYDFLKQKISEGEIIVIDKVLEECRFNSKGLVVQKLDYLIDKSFCKEFNVGEKTEDLIPIAHEKFYRMVDSNFAVAQMIKRLSVPEYEAIKNEYLKSTDCKLIIKGYNLRKGGQDVIIVTEESMMSNDKKPFKKIPAICNILDVKTVNIQEYLEMQEDVNIEIN